MLAFNFSEGGTPSTRDTRLQGTIQNVETRNTLDSRCRLVGILGLMAIILLARFLANTWPVVAFQSNLVIASAAAVHGFWLFIALGRARVTVAGLYMAASAVFVGVAGLMVARDPFFLEVPNPQAALNHALFLSALTQGAISLFLLGRPDPPVPRLKALPARAVQKGQWAGVVLLATVTLLNAHLGPFQEGFAFAGASLISVSSILQAGGMRRLLNMALACGAPLLYATVYHDGTGRLRVVGLFGVVVYVAFLRHGRKWIKLALVATLPLTLSLLGAWRVAFEREQFGSEGYESGLSSMMAPVGIFATLLERPQVSHAWGLSFLSPLRSALPQSWLPSWIPDALGYQLASELYPGRSGTGFSTVSSIYGDWWWNFSYAGLILAAPIMATLLKALDRLAVRSYMSLHARGQLSIIPFVILVALVGTVGDLVWSGFHTWIVRMYARLTALILAFVALLLLATRSRKAGVPPKN